MRSPYNENTKAKRILTVITVIALIAMVLVLGLKCSSDHIEFGPSNENVEDSPIQIQSMIDIGQWEFLTVDLEEIADTMASRTFGSDRKLIRIYTGRMRLGIDLSKAGEDWVKVNGDSVDVTLPHVTLLDNKFIDETKTVAFFEIGSWDQASRDALYHQAYRKMLTRGLTTQNIEMAEANAINQFTTLFKSMDFKQVNVHF